MQPTIEYAKRVLASKNIEVPESEEAIRAAVFEALKEDDFIMAHMFRLGKERSQFTRDDWKSILELSGRAKVENNIAAYMACLSHRLISAS